MHNDTETTCVYEIVRDGVRDNCGQPTDGGLFCDPHGDAVTDEAEYRAYVTHYANAA